MKNRNLSHFGIMYEPYDESTDERCSKEDMLATTNQFAKIKEQVDSDAIVDVATDKKIVRKEKLDELVFSAVSYSHSACWLDELFKRGANIMARNYAGDTPLHKAIERGYRPCVQIILEYAQENNIDRGSLVAAKNSYNFTPLHLAAKQLLIKESSLLLECGADVNERGGLKNNITPLDCVLIGSSNSIINRSRLLEIIRLLCRKHSAQILPHQIAMIEEIDPRLTRTGYEKENVMEAQKLLKDLFSKQF